jgi:hypothetical protein
MGRRRFKPEQIIHLLRDAEIKLAGGRTIDDEVCRELGISGQSYYRWCKKAEQPCLFEPAAFHHFVIAEDALP